MLTARLSRHHLSSFCIQHTVNNKADKIKSYLSQWQGTVKNAPVTARGNIS